MRPEAEDEQQIEALIAEQVHQKLQVILEGEMANALHEFVDKASPFPFLIHLLLLGIAHRTMLSGSHHELSDSSIVAVCVSSRQPLWSGQAPQ